VTKKEIEKKEREAGKFYRNLGYTFNSLVSFVQMRERYIAEMERRLKGIELMGGKACICSVWGEQDEGGYTVPLHYCIIEDGDTRHLCPYSKPTEKEIQRAIRVHGELKEKVE